MNYKPTEIRKIELFAPGTAGERAFRVEKKNGEVEIIDEDKVDLISFQRAKSSFEASQPGEDRNAEAMVFYQYPGEKVKTYYIVAETLESSIEQCLAFLKSRNLPRPQREDLEIEVEFPDFRSVFWESEENA